MVQEVTFDLKSVVNGSFRIHVLVKGRIRRFLNTTKKKKIRENSKVESKDKPANPGFPGGRGTQNPKMALTSYYLDNLFLKPA